MDQMYDVIIGDLLWYNKTQILLQEVTNIRLIT